jgi:UDP-N-acetyl-D-glucosamine dehydrogenase
MKTNKGTVAIVGLGNVGFSVARLCAARGYQTKGLDIKKSRVDGINAKKIGHLIATLEPNEALAEADVVVVCVPTTVDRKNRPSLRDLKGALLQVSSFLRRGTLVIVESTVPVGTIEEVALPVLEQSGFKCGKDFYLAYCPERLDVGNRDWPLRKIPRVLAAVDPMSIKKATKFYASILDSRIVELSSVRAAELAKLLENCFRELNIAFVNELSWWVSKLGVSLNEAIKGASTKPFGFMPFFPGPGIGGDCISTSTLFLLHCLSREGGSSKLLASSRSINTKSTLRVIELVEEAIAELGSSEKTPVITILGLSYKENAIDTTGSPALVIYDELVRKGYQVKLFDPDVRNLSTAKCLEDSVMRTDCVVLTIQRKEFQKLNADYLKRNEVKSVVDCRSQLDGKSIISRGIIYKGIG